MIKFPLNKFTKTQQYLISTVLICCVGAVGYILSPYIGYKVVALLLLVVVSLIAMFFDILPVLLAAVLSALIWDFFFIPPTLTFSVSSPEDMLMLFMYFVIAMVNAALTFKIRQMEKIARKREEKEQTLKLYNTLLNSLSHELRTPIATIIAATDNLQTNSDKLTTTNKGELVSEISKAALRLNGQVENLLNMSRLESGFIQPKKDWYDISELVYDVVNRSKEYSTDYIISIQIKDSLPLFKIDHGLLEQALHNLIHNAILYTPQNSKITVTADCEAGNLILKVEDSGKGFPEEELEKVFSKFYRLKNSKAGGTGLGLSIVKGFVEAHNGNIRLENAKTGGASFIITIPAEMSYPNSLKNE